MSVEMSFWNDKAEETPEMKKTRIIHSHTRELRVLCVLSLIVPSPEEYVGTEGVSTGGGMRGGP